MKVSDVLYSFEFPNAKTVKFQFSIDTLKNRLLIEYTGDLPYWAKLEFHQCPNCPLKKEESPYCPLTLHLIDIVKSFDKANSYDEVFVECKIGERCISQKTTLQKGISSLMGLLIAYSGCPQTRFFKPMAYFHLPFSTTEETIVRATSMFLLGQYLKKMKDNSGIFDLEGLKSIYQNIQIVNNAVAERLKAASKSDSSINAIVLLDLFAKDIPCIIEESLEEIRHIFDAYID